MIRRDTDPLMVAGATLAALAAMWLTPGQAEACGGLFCNASQPVNQAAERIIFSKGEDGTVTAVIQIQYQGPSEQFAWMLPVAGNPEVGVSSNLAFSALQAATNPQYRLNTTVEGTCRDDRVPRFSGGGADAGAVMFADGGVSPPVTVVDQGAVGPYDYVVISVETGIENPAATAVEWLQDNGYDVNDFAADRLSPYLEGGMNLLTFRLTKGNDAGSIRPVVLSFGTGQPSIPIRPTAVAANDDMGVMVWVLGEHRAVPVNYMSLELNEALINWINPTSGYNDVVTRAANEAGGQGFVTEMAGPAEPLAETIFPSRARDMWTLLSTEDYADREGRMLGEAFRAFGQYDGMRDVAAANLPLPEGVDLDTLLSCISCYYPTSERDIDGFEPAPFVASMRTNVIEPMETTREMFEQSPYVTRLYTTMSADEMTRDPVFDFNPDLGEYSNIHTANRVIECSPATFRIEAPYRVTLADGTVVRGVGNVWPFAIDEGELPANRRILRVGNTGIGEVVEDNGAAIDEALRTHNDTVPGPPPRRGGTLCTASGYPSAPGGLGAFALLLIAGVALRRSRRRR